MDVLLPLFQLIYFVVHFLYSLGQAVLDCFYELYFIIIGCLRRERHFTPDPRRLLEDAMKLKKLPRHLGLICLPKQTNSFKHICYLINWSVTYGVHIISLYDYDGILKSKLPSILDNISRLCVGVTVQVIVDGQVYMTECSSTTCQQSNKHVSTYKRNSKQFCGDRLRHLTNGCSNGGVNKSSVITLNVLSVEDGKEDILRLMWTACTNGVEPNVEYIKDNLITKGQTDPDLAIIIGRPICTIGFLPWQIRLTEFLNVPSISRLDYYEFRNLMHLYSKCEQRFGN